MRKFNQNQSSMSRKNLLWILLLLPLAGISQEQPPQNNWGIKFSGYIKNDVFFDTRQTVNIREGDFYLYPSDIKYDSDSADINAKSNFNILAIQTRLSGKITGPDAFGAHTSGLVEGEFFGTQDATINCFRLRHAYAKLSWPSTELILGQTWHGFFVEDCYPDVISVNTGSPYQPFSRNPQIRVTQSLANVKFVVSLMSQRDFTSWGGSGGLRNAALPDMNLRIQYKHVNEEKGREICFGAAADYKILVPRLVTDSNYATDGSINSYAFLAYFKYKCKHITFKMEGTYGQNLYDQVMLGGYAYKYTTDSLMLARADYNYTNLDNVAAWFDFATNGQKFQFGLFGGFSKNLGSRFNILNWNNDASYFTRGKNISYVYRISPRVVFISGKFKLALEGDYSTAGYGSKVNSLGDVENIKPVSNIRLLFACFYYF